MEITIKDFEQDFDKYLELSKDVDIYIIDAGMPIAKISNPYDERIEIAKSLMGIIKADMTLEELKEERLALK